MTGPRFVLVSLAGEQAEIVAQGSTSEAAFREHFLDPYAIEGERYHPGEDAVVRAVLVATDRSHAVSVPVWSWTGEDGAARFLCQASDDGSPPAISVFSLSEGELVKQLDEQLRSGR